MARKDWVRNQGRANAGLKLAATAMGADFIEPADEKSWAGMQGRTRGCTFELRIGTPGGAKDPALILVVRHYHSQAQFVLENDGMQLPNIDPVALRAAIESACDTFATQH